MKVRSEPDVAGLLDRLVAEALPGRRGLSAWRAFLKAPAPLMRRLPPDPQTKTGLSLGEFDALGLQAGVGGTLRVTVVGEPETTSRSGVTSPIARAVVG